jgi:hypothetical protein
MTPTHLQHRLWHRTACGQVGVLRQTVKWRRVTCPACLLRKPDAKDQCEPDVVVRVKQ